LTRTKPSKRWLRAWGRRHVRSSLDDYAAWWRMRDPFLIRLDATLSRRDLERERD